MLARRYSNLFDTASVSQWSQPISLLKHLYSVRPKWNQEIRLDKVHETLTASNWDTTNLGSYAWDREAKKLEAFFVILAVFMSFYE